MEAKGSHLVGAAAGQAALILFSLHSVHCYPFTLLTQPKDVLLQAQETITEGEKQMGQQKGEIFGPVTKVGFGPEKKKSVVPVGTQWLLLQHIHSLTGRAPEKTVLGGK